MPITVLILAFDGVELLDHAGPYEVFTSANGRLPEPRFAVHTASRAGGLVHSANGLAFHADRSFADAPRADVIVLPGGAGTLAQLDQPDVLAFVREQCAGARIVLSICGGARFLAALGLLDGLRATTHHNVLEWLRAHAPRCDVVEGLRYVDSGRIVTSAGVSAGIDASLHVVARVAGLDCALATARHIEYEWSPAP
ncbi:MAG: DJ-1/PfpI family protein [Planctomycetes bacterium]|nr:DJ-1/PfpI family protein [Planctomycetota bacterium]